MNNPLDQIKNTGRLKLQTEKFQTLAVGKRLDRALRKLAEPVFDNREIIAAMRKAYFADIDELDASGEVVIPE